ncbi:hypothetical protein EJB05_32629, partial [Eragrostis curvula]
YGRDLIREEFKMLILATVLVYAAQGVQRAMPSQNLARRRFEFFGVGWGEGRSGGGGGAGTGGGRGLSAVDHCWENPCFVDLISHWLPPISKMARKRVRCPLSPANIQCSDYYASTGDSDSDADSDDPKGLISSAQLSLLENFVDFLKIKKSKYGHTKHSVGHGTQVCNISHQSCWVWEIWV